MDALRIETLTGRAIAPVLGALARLRIAVFREAPYLYDGDEAYEADYLAAFAASPSSALVVAWHGDVPVGCATCLPLPDTERAIRAPFDQRGWDPVRFFYFGESVLLPAYRGRGAGVAFFTAREAHARRHGHADFACFCAVVRPGESALAPFWYRRGFTPYPDLTCRLTWRQTDTQSEVENTLSFWIKPLRGDPLP